MAHPRYAEVRQTYQFRCGYCGVSEVDAGGELTVDHYQPLAARGTDEPANLVYACIRCNQFKGDFFPGPLDVERGWRVLHPLHDDTAGHFRLDVRSGRLEPLTETGRFHISLLQLNRPALVEHRLRARLTELILEQQRMLVAENERLRAALEAQRAYAARLRRLLGLPEAEGD